MRDGWTYPKALRFRCHDDKMRPSGWGEGSLGERRDGLTAGRRPVLTLILVGVALACAGPAAAASPQRIYKDLADNGRIDGRYTKADIARAFNLERVTGTDQRRPAQAESRLTATPPARTAKRPSRKIPFSGLDLALLTVGGGPLLLIGVGLRRRLAPATHSAEVASS